MASTIQQTKFIMDNDRIEDDISDDEIYEAIQNSLKELKVIIFYHWTMAWYVKFPSKLDLDSWNFEYLSVKKCPI